MALTVDKVDKIDARDLAQIVGGASVPTLLIFSSITITPQSPEDGLRIILLGAIASILVILGLFRTNTIGNALSDFSPSFPIPLVGV